MSVDGCPVLTPGHCNTGQSPQAVPETEVDPLANCNVFEDGISSKGYLLNSYSDGNKNI